MITNNWITTKNSVAIIIIPSVKICQDTKTHPRGWWLEISSTDAYFLGKKGVKAMKKMITLLACMAILILPLISYAATQQQFDWSGGPKYSHNIVEKKTLAEISEKAAHDAALSGLPIEYKTADGSIVLQAFPDYGKSNCDLVHEKAWEHGKLVMNAAKEVCNRNYEIVPYTVTVPSIPSIR